MALPISHNLIEDYLKTQKNTAPGKDGIHNMAWKNGGQAMISYIAELYFNHTCGLPRLASQQVA